MKLPLIEQSETSVGAVERQPKMLPIELTKLLVSRRAFQGAPTKTSIGSG
jgi:hypothetical protein